MRKGEVVGLAQRKNRKALKIARIGQAALDDMRARGWAGALLTWMVSLGLLAHSLSLAQTYRL